MSDPLATLRSALADRYAIERELGRGGMATVYLARDIRQDRRVAIKVLHPDFSVALGAERFQREIAIASSLTHPHIVPLYESGEAGGSLFYVMPYIEGETLRARLDREKQLPLEDAVRIACEVASALDYAHRHGVVHRDVKPANILLEDGHAVIADFGIARALSRATGEHTLTVTGVTLGTPSYMSPEQASAEREIDGRSDIYALGCVVYEMLAGMPPFTGPNPQAVMARHAMDTAPSIRVIRNIIPPEVEAAIFCAMAKSPADRFATAQQFADALTGNGGMGATLRYTAKWAVARKRRKTLWTFAIGTALLIPAAAGGWMVFGPGVTAGTAMHRTRLPERIAVLYFYDGSSDQSLGHVADGLTEAVIEELSGVEGLQVISSRGVDHFRGTGDFAAVGEALDVGTIVVGEVRPANDSILVSLRLYEGDAGTSFAKPTTLRLPASAMLAARDSIAGRVAELLRTEVGVQAQLFLERESTTSSDAWVLVQRARRVRRSADSLLRAGQRDDARARLLEADSLLMVARQLDPAWSVPLVARGSLAYRRGAAESGRRQEELLDLAITLADSALAIAPRDPDALELRGTVRFAKVLRGVETREVEIARLLRLAEADLDTAIRRNPRQASALATLSQLLYRKYDRVGAATNAELAYKADAYLASAPLILWMQYVTNYDLGNFDAARENCDEGRRRFPTDGTFVVCQLWLLLDPAEEPDIAQAWRLAARLDSLAAPARKEYMTRLGQIVVAGTIARAAGKPTVDSTLADSARRVLGRARADRQIDPEADLMGYEAAIRVMLGDHDAAIALLQEYLLINPVHREGLARNRAWFWRDLENDPRFKALTGSRN